MKKATIILSVCLAIALTGCGVLAYEWHSWKKSFSDTFALWQEEYDRRTELEAQLEGEKRASSSGENIAVCMLEALAVTGRATEEEALVLLTQACVMSACEMYLNGDIDKDTAAAMLASLDNDTTLSPAFVPLMVDVQHVLAELATDNQDGVEKLLNDVRQTNYFDAWRK